MRLRSGRPGAAVAALTVGLVLLGMGSTASAAGSRLAFELPAGGGYRVLVQAVNATASLTATRARRGAKTGSLSTYFARRRAGAAAIRATFGSFGRIAMRFRPGGRITYSRRRAGCLGPDRYTFHHGVFAGSLRFRGEDGYVDVKAARVKGESVSPPALRCAGSGQPAGAGKKPTFRFQAGHRSGLTADYFLASREAAEPVRFLATEEQTEGTVAIRRLAVAKGGPRTFATDDALSFATLAPTPPFRGAGSLTRDSLGARLWNGPLTVSFPGAPEVLLTGPEFKTTLTRSW